MYSYICRCADFHTVGSSRNLQFCEGSRLHDCLRRADGRQIQRFNRSFISTQQSGNTAGFTFGKFAVISRNYLASHPWGTLAWVALLSVGLILPAEWVYERLQITMPESTEAMFEGIMREPLGYMAIGIFAPVVEEIVFRGAILRILLSLFSRSWHWVAIIFSALIFGAIHLNLAQGLHAFVIGLLLGWMYYRTSSVVPGILLHWINNTVAYLMFHLMPQFGDGKLIDFFHGDESLMYKGLGCSLLIILPSLFQIARRMKRTDR